MNNVYAPTIFFLHFEGNCMLAGNVSRNSIHCNVCMYCAHVNRMKTFAAGLTIKGFTVSVDKSANTWLILHCPQTRTLRFVPRQRGRAGSARCTKTQTTDGEWLMVMILVGHSGLPRSRHCMNNSVSALHEPGSRSVNRLPILTASVQRWEEGRNSLPTGKFIWRKIEFKY